MTKESKLKKWSWYKIVNLVVLIILTIVFTVLFVINQKKYTIAFLISVLLLGIWVTGYFMGHFLFMNCIMYDEAPNLSLVILIITLF
ncbi:hypothetical protein [Spiroplasma endosymbiont of Glossina fuscipes fuscipes]|uniref:hypothetical protein n=1 Tax=Spiroplasma endosymbiont of Glossina fuscipes fuscipes TaxID=2004463 RepID=UPI003C78DB23